jgi:chromosome segregation ATPase
MTLEASEALEDKAVNEQEESLNLQLTPPQSHLTQSSKEPVKIDSVQVDAINFHELSNVIDIINKIYQEKFQILEITKVKAEQKLADIRKYADEKVLQETIIAETKNIQELEQIVKDTDKKLTTVKERAKLLQQQFNQLQQQQVDLDFAGDVDAKVDWVIKREALQQLETASDAEAAKRKIPLQQATIKGRIKFEQGLANRILAAITEMQAEYKKLEEQQNQLLADNQALQTDLQEREHEHVNCVNIEKERQEAYAFAETCLENHKTKISDSITNYNNLLNQLKNSLAAAKNELSGLQATAGNLETTIRRLQNEIQELQPRVNIEIIVNVPVDIKALDILFKRDWFNGLILEDVQHGIFRFKRWVRPERRPAIDHAIVAQIASKQAAIQGHQNNLNNTNANIANKKAEITRLENSLRKLEDDWTKTKDALDKEQWQLEDNKKKALGEREDARIRREQKENEITHLKESIRRKEVEIEQGQAILDDRKNNLIIFNNNLAQCQQRIAQIELEGQQNDENNAKLPAAKEINLTVDTDANAKLTLARLNAKTALDNTRVEEAQLENTAVELQTKLTTAKEHLFELTNPANQMVASKRQDAELACQRDIEVAEREMSRTQEMHADHLHTLLLGQGLIVSGYQTSQDSLDSLITCLLQGIFAAYPLYKLGVSLNATQPETWAKHIAVIKQKILQAQIADGTTELSPETVTKIVDLINEEYQQDDYALTVNLLGRPLLTKNVAVKNTVVLNVWQNGQQFLALVPEKQLNSKNANVRAHRLVAALMSPNHILRPLCEKIILRDCGKALIECAPEILANYCREELQREYSQQNNTKNKESIFTTWFNGLSAKIELPTGISEQTEQINLLAAHYCLSTLNAIQAELNQEQQQEFFKLCLQQFLAELKACIMSEIKRRAENESKTQQLLDQSKAELANKMQAMEADMRKQEELIAQLAKDIETKQTELNRRKEQANQLQQHYEQQANEIEAEIQKFIDAKQEVEAQLTAIIEGSEDHEEKIAELKNLQEDIKARQEKLQAEKAEVNNKLNDARKTKKALEKEQIEVNGEAEKYAGIRQLSEKSKATEDQKIKFLDTWRKFLKDVHLTLLNDEPAFKQRHQLLEQFKQLPSANGLAVQDCYNFLMKIDCLKQFNQAEIKDCIAKANQEEFRMLTTNWSTDLNNVLDDVLGSPDFSSELFSPLTIKGNNILWSEALAELKAIFEKRMNCYGFGFSGNKLIVKDASLIGTINALPDSLKKLLAKYMEIHRRHYTVISENNSVTQTPRWEELERILSPQEITDFINNAAIDFTEVLRAYVDSIELVVGHHLYLDEDIELPGINITFFSKDKIHCKKNLIIKTTAKQLSEIKIEKAKGGDEYKSESGRAGDDGLDGLPGDCAGHIIIKAENNIENLATLRCVANGSNGLNGQLAGDGGKGYKGVDMPDAEASDTDGAGKAQFVIAEGRTPGMDENRQFKRKNEFSGPGGDAGLAGLGGEGGLPGDIVITDKTNEVRVLASGERVFNGDAALALQNSFEQKIGNQGDDAKSTAKGGDPGTPGATGADHLRNKRSFFKKTTDHRGKLFDDRIYDHPEDYIEPDEACGICLSAPIDVFIRDSTKSSGYSERKQRELKVYGYYTSVGMQDINTYHLHPQRDKRSRGDKGRDNAGRRKAESARRKAQQSQTIQNQLAQITRINQLATTIQQNHAWLRFDNKYEAEIAKYQARSEQLGKEIEQCRNQEETCAKRSAEISTQLQQVDQTIQQLDNQLQQINQLAAQMSKELSANELAQLQNLKQSVQQGAAIMQVQAELACANIDVNSKENLQTKFQQLHAAIQNALQACQNTISQDIEATKANKLLQAERLATMQQEYARLAQAYNDSAAQKSQLSDLNKLMHELAQLEQKQETTQKSEQILAQGGSQTKTEKADQSLPTFALLNINDKDLLFNIPTQQQQNEAVLAIFANMFSKAGAYNELTQQLTDCKPEQIWLYLLNALRRELKVQRDVNWMSEQLDNWKKLLKYCETIIKASAQSIDVLNDIYAQIIPLAFQLAKVDKDHAGKCLVALKNLSAAIEQRTIELLIELCVKQSCEGREKDEHKEQLLAVFNTAINTSCVNEPPLTFVQQLQRKLDCLRSYHALILACKEQTHPIAFAELINLVIANTTQPYPDASQTKDTFKEEIQAAANQFNIQVALEKIQCGLVLVNPNEKIVNLHKQYSYAYVIKGDKLFYLAKGKSILIPEVDVKALLQLFPQLKAAKLNQGERYKPLIANLTKTDLEKIRDLTQHTHIVTATNEYYFTRLQLEIEYLFVEATKKIEVLQGRQGQQPTLQEVAAINENVMRELINKKAKLGNIIQALSTAAHPLATALLRQAVKNHQILAIMRQQMLFSAVDSAAQTASIQRCSLLSALYNETQACVKTTSTKLKQELQELAQTTLVQFIQTAAIKPEEWLSILQHTENVEPLKLDQSFLGLAIFQKIIDSHNIDLIMQAYKACQTIALTDKQHQQAVQKALDVLYLAALEKQMSMIYESLQAKSKDPATDVNLIKAMLEKLAQIGELWFTPHCLITVEQRFAALKSFKDIAITITTESLSTLSALMYAHHQEQKKLLLSKDWPNTAQNNPQPNNNTVAATDLAAKLTTIAKRMEAALKNPKPVESVCEAIINDFATYLTTLKLLLKNTSDLVSQTELEAIEKLQYLISQYLYKYYPAANSDKTSQLFWRLINNQSQGLASLLHEHYLIILADQFKQIKEQAHKERMTLQDLLTDISAHYDVCSQNDQTSVIAVTDNNNATPQLGDEQIHGNKSPSYAVNRKSFTKLLLKKLEYSYLYCCEQKDDSSMQFAQTQFKQIQADIKQQKTIEAIEQYLLDKVNVQGIQMLKAKILFANTECPTPELKSSLQALKQVLYNNNNFTAVFTAWNNTAREIISHLNKSRDVHTLLAEKSWFNQFILDSNELWSHLITESENQEDILYDREISLRAWFDMVYDPAQKEKFAPLRQLIQTLSLAGQRINHYLYTDRLVETQSKTNNAVEVTTKWQQIEQHTLQSANTILSEINHDLGTCQTKYQFIAQLKNIKPVYNLTECQQQETAIQNIFNTSQTSMQAIAAAKLNSQAAIATSVQRLLAIDFKQSFSAQDLRKIYLNVKQLKDADIANIAVFSKNFIAYQAKVDAIKDIEQINYSHLIAMQLAGLYRAKFVLDNKSDKATLAQVSMIDQVLQLNQRPDITLAVYFQLNESPVQSEQPVDGAKIISALLNTNLTSKNIFTEFRNTLVEKEQVWKLPYFMAVLPMLNKEIFTKENCEQTLQALFKLNTVVASKERKNVEQKMRDKIHAEVKQRNFVAGYLCIEPLQRIRLLQTLLIYYVHHCILPLLPVEHQNRGVIARALDYLDRLIEKALVNNEQSSDLQTVFNEINKYYQFIAKLPVKSFAELMAPASAAPAIKKPAVTTKKTTSTFFQQPAVKSTITATPLNKSVAQPIAIKNLMTPIEISLAEQIVKHGYKDKVSALLYGKTPEQWESVLRDTYFTVIKAAINNINAKPEENKNNGQFMELFTDAYVIAQQNNNKSSTSYQNEAQWLNTITYLLTAVKQAQLSIGEINLILKSVLAVGNCEHVYTSMNAQLHPLVFMKECLFAECAHSIKQCLNDTKQQELILQQLDKLKIAIFNEDKGYLFLAKLSNALQNYHQEDKTYLYPTYLQDLLTLIAETQAFKQPHLLEDKDYKLLDEANILRWNYQLRREKYIQLFGLQEYALTKEIDTFVHLLNRLEKEKSSILVNRFTKLLRQNLKHFVSINLLNGFVANFAKLYWEFDETTLTVLEQTPVAEWEAYLEKQAEARFNTQKVDDRTPAEIVKEMRKELNGINSHVKHLLDPLYEGESYIEKTITAIKTKLGKPLNNKVINEWTEDDIKAWIVEFKKQAVSNFSDTDKVVEFAAVMMRACQLKLKKTPRPTQLTALLLFIDAMQKRKGRLANIATGEGKSMITAMTAIVCALLNEKVDVVTSNEVLAERDAKAHEELFELFNIKVSNNCDNACERNENLRRDRYTQCQVIYGTTGSFQRDLLLTNFFEKSIRGQPGNATTGNCLIIDEVDSMFIDNAEKILYISHSIQDLRHLNDLFLMIWAAVNSAEREQETERNVEEVAEFVRKRIAEKQVVIPNILKEFIDRRMQVWIKSAYTAKRMKLGKEYIIPKHGEKHNQVVIMDLDTGVEQLTTQWSNGLHQFIQLKHSQKLSEESLKAVFMANVIFFKSYNGNVVGMTGTLGQEIERDLMAQLYKIDYFRLPRNKTERYVQEEPVIVATREEWKQAIIDDLRAKQCAPGSSTQADQAAAEQTIAKAKQRLAELEQQKVELEKKLNDAVAQEKDLKQELDKINILLARDVVVSESTTPESKDKNSGPESRKSLLEQKAKQEAALQQCQVTIKQYQSELAELISGNDGIVNNTNAIRNAEYIKVNSGARSVLVINNSVNDTKELKKLIRNDPVLSRCKLTVIKSKDDMPPADKIGLDHIIIATNIAGRGTDIDTLEILEKYKGLSVDLTYMPPNIRIEKQNFFRTARNGNSGSGKFIICEPRLLENPNITVDYLREIRDIEEARRLEQIRTHGIPKLEREQKLFEKFIALQKAVRAKLEANLKEPKAFDRKAVDAQLKSLQNKWAFFLDKLDAKITDVEKFSEAELMQEYAKFEAEVWKLLEQQPFRLITEPAELMKMARYCMDPQIDKHFSEEAGYRFALQYLDAIIEREPDFAGFAHYYKAHCNFGLKQNSLDSKASARCSLKRAIDLLDEKIGRLSTAAQFIRVLRTRKQEKLGYGLEADDFTRSLSNEISLIQVHINAAREALGTELSADSFKSGTVTGEEHKEVFNKIRQNLKQVIKDYRLSKKAVIKALNDNSSAEGIYYQDKLVELPPASAAARSKIINLIKLAVSADLQKREQITPDLFKEVFLTSQQFLDGLGSTRYSKQRMLSLHADAFINAKGKSQWENEIFNGVEESIIQQIKTHILGLAKALTEHELAEQLVALGVANEKAQAIVQHLLDKNILKASEIYVLSKEVQAVIKDYLEKIELREQPALDIAALKLEAYPEFRGKVASIASALQPGAVLTQAQLDLSKNAFNLLFHLLKEQGYFKQTLLQRLKLDSVFTKSEHHYDVESELLRIYDSNITGNPCDILLCKDPAEKSTQLWSYLKAMKIVKDPAVKFKLIKDPSDLLDVIKDQIKNNIGHLIAGKSKDDQEKYVDSIYSALEKSIGKIKQFKDLKIDPKTLQDFLQGGKIPPELADFTQQCYDIVLSLAEDKGWDWNVFACALIGIVQIAAGVIIGAMTFGAAAFISAVLINEGIGDLVFAVQSGISGNFSWSAYGNRKWQSLLISVATAGIGAGLGTLATTGPASVGALAQKFVVHLAQAGLSCIVSMAADQLVKQAMSLITKELERNFETWVRSSATYQTAEKRLQTLIGKFYDKFGVEQASKIIADIMRENTRARSESFVNIFGAKLTEVMQRVAGQLATAAEQLERSSDSAAAMMGTIARVAGAVATATDIINKFREVASLASETLDGFERSLERAYNAKAAPQQTEVQQANQAKTKEKFCEEILKQQTDIIIGEIKQFVTRTVVQPGAQALLQMAVRPVNEMLNKSLSEELEKLSEKIPRSDNPDDDVSALTKQAATAADESSDTQETKTLHTHTDNNNRKSSTKANRSPAAANDDEHHTADKTKTFAERTQHQSGFTHTNKRFCLLQRELTAGANDGQAASPQSGFDFDPPIEQSFDLFDIAAGVQAIRGIVKIIPHLPQLAKGAAAQIQRLGLFAAGTTSKETAQTLVGASTHQMRSAAQSMIASDTEHPLRFLLNNEGRFFKTRGLSHAELMDNPRLIQMGHITSKVSGETERIMLQGAWENQFNALTIERSSIGGFVHNTAIDIGGIAVDLRTAQSWESFGFLQQGTVEAARRLAF